MARRPGGKTERRKARQRRAQRPASPPSASAPALPAAAPEAADTPSPETTRRITAPSPARAYTAASSRLTDRERAEYHYVERDLRNIGILTAVLVALLIASYFVFSALGLTG